MKLERNHLIIGILILISALVINQFYSVAYYGDIMVIPDLKEDGTPNLELELYKPYDLEIIVRQEGTISSQVELYNTDTDESYRTPIMPTGSPTQTYIIHMTYPQQMDNWNLRYYQTGELRTIVYIDTAEWDLPFSFIEPTPTPTHTDTVTPTSTPPDNGDTGDITPILLWGGGIIGVLLLLLLVLRAKK